jgi:hypothetical protein
LENMMATTRRRTKAAAPVEEPEDSFEELEDGDDELEDLEDATDDEVEEAPAPKTRARKATKAAAPAKAESGGEYNTAWLAEHVSEVTGTDVDSRSLRMLLRKMAAEGELERVVGEDRQRYTFRGPNDPTVKTIVRKIKGGELTVARRAGLEAVKEKAAPPAKKAAPRKAAPAKAAPAKATRTRRSRTAE